MGKGTVIGKVARPENPLVWVEKDGTVMSKTLPQLGRGKQHGSNTMDGVKKAKAKTVTKRTTKAKAKAKK
jgi:hypothetical protein